MITREITVTGTPQSLLALMGTQQRHAGQIHLQPAGVINYGSKANQPFSMVANEFRVLDHVNPADIYITGATTVAVGYQPVR